MEADRAWAGDAAPGGGASFFGHPRGLAYLAFTEAWERFSFSGMQALLVLYMVDQLLQPGHIEHVAGFAGFRHLLESIYGPLSPQPLSSVIFGLYTSLVFLSPVFGGILGDRVFGHHRMVTVGAVLMAAGQFFMMLEVSFLPALLLLIVGCGCLKGNISTQVGSLYADGDRRRTDAFQLFSIGINAGVILAPLICGTLGELYGWRYGFAAAGVGMLIGLAVYSAGRRELPQDRRVARSVERLAAAPLRPRLLAFLIVVFTLTVCFLVTAGQLGNVYSLWLKSGVDRRAFGVFVPVTWFQSATPIVSALATPLFVALWRRQAQRGTEPSLLTKMGVGLALSAVALAWLAVLTVGGQHFGAVSWLWVLPVHLLIGIAYLFVYPVGLALFSRTAPPGARAMYIGIFFLTSFVAGNLVGLLGREYQPHAAVSFWLLHAGIGAAGAVLVVLFGRPLSRVLSAAPLH
jgi:POT family proton-dependent oligopeptide transporter